MYRIKMFEHILLNKVIISEGINKSHILTTYLLISLIYNTNNKQ